MEERTIEVNVVSATGLKNVKAFGGHQTSYVVAYIFPQTKRSTKVDHQGGLNPTWNSKLTFLCDDRILEKGGAHLTLEVYAEGVLSDKLIGRVIIPLHLPVTSNGSSGKIDGTPVEYSVRTDSGKERGFLKVGVKIGEKRTIQKYTAPQQQGLSYSQEYKKQSYPPASYGASAQQFYPGAYLSSESAGSVYPRQNVDAISPYPNSSLQVPSPFPSSSDSAISSSSSSEPVTAYPVMGYPVGGNYQQYPQYPPQVSADQQYPPQGYPNQSYPPPYYSQQAPYYQQAQQPYYTPPPPRYSSGGSGMGTGLLAGALGGLLLGDVLDFY
ncbi:hypothetical protein R1sor_005065 [Riccia sorocarpa]|uniref:C2 domain-containing protein n=1 Tax=Riccia sorocarpa TaxID=122646 RepID=A0ABD3HQ02_9MARC